MYIYIYTYTYRERERERYVYMQAFVPGPGAAGPAGTRAAPPAEPVSRPGYVCI